ncbi:Rv3654c family TadE-like protein [Pseudonocardia sp. N23]|uniref:Rv3654c family TadE-like protein n=1 Tax=Pseudonocardia sp. N23 TaxID=1987376 RepID=UPI000C027FB6|nr:Rv3654c family TadE-like protein [Pseudonocardia sp. N23]GAY09300.1 hypothetical protein TOK_3258 [Pseudonocardia sp. N23]
MTVEAAIALGVLVVVALAAMGAILAVVAAVRCTDAAREAARLAARGEPDRGRAVASQLAPPGAVVEIASQGDDVVASVTAPAVRPFPLRVSARAVAATEPAGPPAVEPGGSVEPGRSVEPGSATGVSGAVGVGGAARVGGAAGRLARTLRRVRHRTAPAPPESGPTSNSVDGPAGSGGSRRPQRAGRVVPVTAPASIPTGVRARRGPAAARTGSGQDRAGRRRGVDDSGVATVHAALAAVLVLGLAVVGIDLGGAVLARHRAEAAADLAGLAAAGDAALGQDAACTRARTIAAGMDSTLRQCVLDGWDALVEVSTPRAAVLGNPEALGRARAGPASPP